MQKDRKMADDRKFILFTMIISGILAILYSWKLYAEWNNLNYSESPCGTGSCPIIAFLIIGMNLLYIPYAAVFQKKGFHWFYLVYAAVLLCASAFESTYIYNNYTALFIVCIVFSIQPKIKTPAVIFYLTMVTALFLINKEKDFYLFLIHVVRSIWYIGIVEYVLADKFRRKKLVLYEDERKILDQLCDGKVYQKEVEGFSENTIYRKLKAARERNGNLTRDQLVDQYRNQKEKEKNEAEEN